MYSAGVRHITSIKEKFVGWVDQAKTEEEINLEDKRFSGKIGELEEVVQIFVKKANGVASKEAESIITPDIRNRLLVLAGFPEGTADSQKFSTLRVEHTVAVVVGKNTKEKVAPRAFTIFLNPDKLGMEKTMFGEKIFKFRPLEEIKSSGDLIKVINNFILLPPQEADFRYASRK